MKIDVISMDAKKSGTIELNGSLFGLEPRPDILNKVVRWQLAKKQQGTHSVLTRSEVSYSTKKVVRQKGSGSGRHGSRRAPIFRKGGVYKGPNPRSHSFDLNKKFRALGLRHALSAKYSNGQLVILEKAELKNLLKQQALAHKSIVAYVLCLAVCTCLLCYTHSNSFA